MHRWDQGMGIVGLVGLATIFVLVFTFAVPANFASEQIKWSDWLGFAGNLVGAGVALAAATVAWRTVQQQIEAQREATLLQVLSREEDRLEEELHATESCLDFYDRMREAALLYPDKPEAYATAIMKFGVSTDHLAMRKTLDDSGIDYISTHFLLWVMTACSAILASAKRCGDAIYYSDGGADSVREIGRAKAALQLAEVSLHKAIEQILERKIVIEKRLPAIRSRIDNALRTGINV